MAFIADARVGARHLHQNIMKSVRNFYHEYHLDEASSIAVFNLQLPVRKYVDDDTIPDELNLSYASRDVAEAEDLARLEILDKTGLPDFPLSVNVSADFKTMLASVAIYEITVSGPNSKFINTIKTLFSTS